MFMNHKNILLCAALTFVTPTFFSAIAAPQSNSAAGRQDEKAKKEAFDKLCSENRKKFNELRSQIDQAARAEKYAEIDKMAAGFLELYGKPGVTNDIKQFKNTIIGNLNRKKKENLPLIRKHYENIIGMLDGDAKVQMINDYADYLTREKLAKPDEVKTILHTRLSVKSASVKCMFETYISECDLEKAEEYAQIYLATIPADRLAEEYGYIAAKFSSMSVYGCKSATKYYKMQLGKVTDPDKKVQAITNYANFQKRFFLISDTEYEKLMASRKDVPGISEQVKFNLACEPIDDKMTLTIERIAAYNRVFETYKGNREYRLMLYRKYWDLLGMEYFENVILNDSDVDPLAYLGTYATKKSYGRYEQVERTLTKYETMYCTAAMAIRGKALDAKAKLEKCQANATAKKQALTAAESAEKQAGKDKAARDTAKKITDTARTALNEANAACSQARNEYKPIKEEWDRAFGDYCNILRIEIQYFEAISVRYYDTKNPYCMYKCIELVQKRAKMEEGLGSYLTKMSCLHDVARFANEAKDSDTVFNVLKDAEKIMADPVNQKDRSFYLAKDYLNFIKKYVAQSYYREENYEKTIEYALPLLEVKNWQLKAQELEAIIAGSYVALGELEKALPHAEKMVDAAPNWMKSRLREQVKDLKERIEEQKKR